ncbi:MAG: TerB family tellurite resistance protein [Steroidobacteraceae bacterium]
MLRLKDWLSRHLGKDSADSTSERAAAVNLAVAALLVEILRADYATTAAERAQVLASIRGLLGLDQAACEALLEDAERSIDEAHDLYQFTSEINRSWSAEDKSRLVEQLWQVAQADATVHKYEEHLIRRIADLLHVSHREFIAAKLRSAGGA